MTISTIFLAITGEEAGRSPPKYEGVLKKNCWGGGAPPSPPPPPPWETLSLTQLRIQEC